MAPGDGDVGAVHDLTHPAPPPVSGLRLAAPGQRRWSRLVAGRWEQTVATSLAAVKAEAERHAAAAAAPRRPRSRQPPPEDPLRSGQAAPRRHIPTTAVQRLLRSFGKQDEFRRRSCADMGADHCSSDQPSASSWICCVRNRRSASVAARWAARSNAACAASGCPSRRNIVPRAACSK